MSKQPRKPRGKEIKIREGDSQAKPGEKKPDPPLAPNRPGDKLEGED